MVEDIGSYLINFIENNDIPVLKKGILEAKGNFWFMFASGIHRIYIN